MVVSRAARCGTMRSKPSAQNEQLLQAASHSGANITCCTTSCGRPLNRSARATLPPGPSNTGLLHLDPRHVAAIFAERVAGAGQLLLARHQRLARLDPRLAGYDPVRLHGCPP